MKNTKWKGVCCLTIFYATVVKLNHEHITTKKFKPGLEPDFVGIGMITFGIMRSLKINCIDDYVV